jgi:cytochrome P450/nitrite reductase/ring-hydroxylating ferredoxin subunit
MKSDAFVCVANVAELKTAGPFAFSPNGVDIALVRAGGEWRAFEGRCPHQGALLGEGELDGGALVCRNHRWRFSIETGRREDGPECLASHPLSVRDGGIFVDLTGSRAAAKRSAAARSLDDLPGPKGLPLVGNLHQLDAKRVHLTLEDWAAKYGSTYQFRLGPARILATTDPALIEEALRARPETFRRYDAFRQVLTEAGILSVFNAEGEAWRPQRRLSVAALAQRHLRQLYPNIGIVSERLKARWIEAAARGETLDIVEEFKRATVDVTMLIVFGHDVNTVGQLDDVIQRELEVMLPGINRRIFALFPTWRYVQMPADRRLNRALANVRAWLDGLLNDARARFKLEPERKLKPSNFIEAMLTAVDEQGKPFADDVIRSNLLTMLLAGEDTTAFTLAWAVHHLCESPAWAEKIRSEADRVIGAANTAADFETASRLSQAHAVANETMRLRPVVPILSLQANFDTRLGDIRIPKDTAVFTICRPAAVDETKFADGRGFRPDRWLEKMGASLDASAQMTFGSGPRMCPGRSLAQLQMNALLSMLYKNFDVERVGASGEVSELFGQTMSPKGLRVRLHVRSKAAAA